MPHTYGIMQGRLSPPEDGRFQSFPRNSWREEFRRAHEAGSGDTDSNKKSSTCSGSAGSQSSPNASGKT